MPETKAKDMMDPERIDQPAWETVAEKVDVRGVVVRRGGIITVLGS